MCVWMLDVHYVMIMVVFIAVIAVEMSMTVGVNKWYMQVKTFGNLSKSQNQMLTSFPKKSTSLGKS